MQKAIDVAVVSVKRSDYRIHFWYMSKDDAINKMNSSDLKKVDYYKFFSLHIKMGEATYYQRNNETILNTK